MGKYMFGLKAPNLSESLSKYKGYEYTNLIFRAFIHLF